MDTSIGCRMRADADVVFELAAAVEDWPSRLPHYRWVRVLAGKGESTRLVEMAARRTLVGNLAIPVRWTAIQRTFPSQRRITFEHVRGITRGMRVLWTIEPAAGVGAARELDVHIRHVFEPAWPAPDGLVQQLVGEYFVNAIARRTLWHIARIAETRV